MCDVMILDSGVDQQFFRENFAASYAFEFSEEQNCFIRTECSKDVSGHGSACAYVISRLAPSVRFGSIRVLDADLFGHSNRLEQALRLCLTINVRILHMSFSMESLHIDEHLKHLFQKLYDQGKWVVASVKNGSYSSYPAALPTVIGVNGTLMPESDAYWFDENKLVQAAADLTPMWTQREFNEYCFFGGNSKAAAVVTGHLVNQLIRHDRNETISYSALLAQLALRKKWDDGELQRMLPSDTCMPTDVGRLPRDLYTKIKKIVCSYYQHGQSDLANSHLLISRNGIDRQRFSRFMSEIESTLGISANKMHWEFRHFTSFDHFICHIERIYHNESNTYAQGDYS
ncbi:S8 family serine peptidase [Paenibacillus humicus]|uniref:S8 family serine peptidase n=1 Tax=Paenibacillus humicus TaxID=412861 RepID=UPI003D2B5DEC